MKLTLTLTLVILILGLLFIRLAPLAPADWHQASGVTTPGTREGAKRHLAARQITTPPEALLTALDRIISETPRTQRLAGSVADQMITYVTRTRIMGFPDVTTVEVVPTDAGPLLVIRGRARFGGSDMGVNRTRIDSWLAQLGPLVVTPA